MVLEDTEYKKINTLFLRDGSFKVMQDVHHDVYVRALLNTPIWQITEKIDGINTRVIIEDNSVSFHGRTSASEIRKDIMAAYINLFQDKFQAIHEAFEKKPVVIYGETFGGKIQGMKNHPVDFACFDITVNGYYLDPLVVQSICEQFEIQHVPVLANNSVIGTDIIDMVQKGFKSNLTDNNAEGVVFKPIFGLYTKTGDRLVYKIKTKDFRRS